MFVADAQLNVVPNLAAKKDIVANTVDLARASGIVTPLVALLAAMDYVTPAFVSTADAAALKTMAEQGMFGNAIADGPLTVDSALSAEAARANGVKSEVAGRPDILIAPTMEAALMVVRTLTGLTGGLAAGIVLGAALPILHVPTARTRASPSRHQGRWKWPASPPDPLIKSPALHAPCARAGLPLLRCLC